KGAPDAAKDSLNLCRKEEKGKTRFAQTVPLLFSSLQQKFKAPHRAGKVKSQKPKAKPPGHQPKRQGQPHDGLAFVF
ncbi:hypothetical protein, partial [Ralstonia sp. NT80]|uniref:hypothetical protein n=1 Tax=Ralstonia sp. NT80 TaxID=1218247 RepID=UPI001E46C664